MPDGWLLRCDPASGRFTFEVGEDGRRAEQDRCVALVSPPVDAAGVLNEYLSRGEEALEPLAGVSLAVWDGRRSELRLVRDRTGVRPLFHARAGRTLIAGTAARDVLAGEGVSDEPNPVVLAEWIANVLSEPTETLFAMLRRVPAGHVLTARGDGERLRLAWKPQPPGSLPAVAADGFGETLECAVASALEDGRAAVFLSGGIDSAAVTVAAARASAARGLPPPLALSVEISGASEAATQRAVATGLGIPQRFATAEAGSGLLERALQRAGASLWPVGALWVPAFDELALAAREEGARVVLDGQGGDELLDVTAGLGTELAKVPLRQLADVVRANRTYTGASTLRSTRRALGLVRRGRSRIPPLPRWLAPDPTLRQLLEERLGPAPATRAELLSSDLVDPYLAHAREETFDAGLRLGVAYRHPYWDAGLVELLHGLPTTALVARGNPKAPARTYVRRHLRAISGPWPRPHVADRLLAAAVAAEGRAASERLGGPRTLLELGVIDGTYPSGGFQSSSLWVILSLETWLRAKGSR